MHTKIESGDNFTAIKEACTILQAGGLVAFPTETVYGLGADALNADAAAKIYAAKGRPSDNPLIVHIADTDAVYKLADMEKLPAKTPGATTNIEISANPEIPENPSKSAGYNMRKKAEMLMEAFWPGPLTLIFPKKEIVPDGTTGGLPTVAIRMPSHPIALSLIRESGIYIAAPSANTSGRPSPTTAQHVAEDMDGRIDMILDGGAVGIGIESTIVDMTGEIPTILRPGFITKSMLEAIIGTVTIDKAIIEPDPNLRPKAPGMKYTHYAPKGILSIVEAAHATDESSPTDASIPADIDIHRVAEEISRLVAEKEAQGYKTAVLTTKEHAGLYTCAHVFVVGESENGQTIAANLYATLRECDAQQIEYMYSEAFDQTELGGAIMNRLLKAAGHRVICI